MRKVGIAFLAFVGLGLAIQVVPYGRAHSNPTVGHEPAWDRPQTREIFFRACKDCHSNATEWPWYSFVAPTSWFVQWHVAEARSHFNVSEWGREKNHGDAAARMLREGEMPPWAYRLAHPKARLSRAERDDLEAGLLATFGEERNGNAAHHAH